MKLRAMVCAALAAMLLLGGSATAADKPQKGPKATTRPSQREAVKSARGVISSVDIEAKTLTVEVKARQETRQLTVITDDTTEFLLDSEPASIVDLRAGMRVTVQPETGVATRVSARSMTKKEQKEYKEGKSSASGKD